MNLLEIKFERNKLRLLKGLCFLMTFTSLMAASRSLKNMINKTDFTDLDSAGIEIMINQEKSSKLSFALSYSPSNLEDSLDADEAEDKDYSVNKEVLDKAVDIAIDKAANTMIKDNVVDIAVNKAADVMLEDYDVNKDLAQMLIPSYEQKMLAIMERDGYSYEELDAVCAACVAESYGDGNCYDECYDIASVFYNRTHSNAFVYEVNKKLGPNTGYNPYYQLAAPGQFGVYFTGSYKKYLGRIDLLGYQAAIDMFYSGVPSNNYLNFNNVPPKRGAYEQLNPPYGNYFSREQKPEDVIDDSIVRQRVMS